MRIIGAISVALVGAVAFLAVGPRPESLVGAVDVSWMPHFNGLMNTGTTLSLVGALLAIRSRNITLHRNFILAAFTFTALFLVSYVGYHALKPGPVKYQGDYRGLYFFVLATHISLAPVVVPLSLISLYRGWTDQRQKHRQIVRFSYPLWLYVAVTGVLVYLMLYL